MILIEMLDVRTDAAAIFATNYRRGKIHACFRSSVTIFPHSPQIIGCRFIHRSLIFPRHTEQKDLSFWAFLLHQAQSPRRLCRSRYRLTLSRCVIPLHSNATGFYLRHRRLLTINPPRLSLQPNVIFPAPSCNVSCIANS